MAKSNDKVYLCGVEGAEREGFPRKGEVRAAPLPHFHPARILFMPEEGQNDPIVCCGGTSTDCIRRRIRRS
jgi:hypothetical protein